MKTKVFSAGDALSMVRFITVSMWPMTAWATSETLGATMGAITAADWISLWVLSTVSGLVALLHRVRRSMEAEALHEQNRDTPGDVTGRQLINWKVFALCHMAGALFVGALAFLMCEAIDMNNYMEAAAIALASWSGAKVADKWADGISDGILGRIGAVFGGSAKRE